MEAGGLERCWEWACNSVYVTKELVYFSVNITIQSQIVPTVVTSK
jgi:hypothetical protein